MFTELLIVTCLIVANGLLALSELALVSSRRSRLESLLKQGNRNASIALKLMDSPSRFLSTVQIGITLVGIFAGAYSGVTIGQRLGSWLDSIALFSPHGHTIGMVITVIGITYVSLILGELVPKRIALAQPEKIAAIVARPLQILSIIATPAVWLLQVSTEAILHLFRQSEIPDSPITEDEIKSLIDEGTRHGVFIPQEKEMIEGVLRLADRTVRVIMTPRYKLIWIDVDLDIPSMLNVAKTHRYSHLLVCRGSIDNPIGVVHVRDLLPHVLSGEPIDLERILSPLLFVPEHATVLQLLGMFKEHKIHMAVVVDEYGVAEGLVTLTDVLESVAGDLPELWETQEREITRRGDRSWLIDGTTPTDMVESATGIEIGEGTTTIASFLFRQFERIPVAGDSIIYGDWRFEVLDMDGHRIDKILMEIGQPEQIPDNPNVK